MTVEPHPKPADRWKHRRRMAYAALAGMIAFPLLALVADGSALGPLAWPLYLSLGAIVAVYTGASTYDDIKIGVSQ
ncbi:MAG: hypothetical protein ACLFVU_01990 [Phycisphaerae bacterium]